MSYSYNPAVEKWPSRRMSQMNQALGQRPCSIIPVPWASPSLLCKNHSVLLASDNTNAQPHSLHNLKDEANLSYPVLKLQGYEKV